jgi:hypothetical protein
VTSSPLILHCMSMLSTLFKVVLQRLTWWLYSAVTINYWNTVSSLNIPIISFLLDHAMGFLSSWAIPHAPDGSSHNLHCIYAHTFYLSISFSPQFATLKWNRYFSSAPLPLWKCYTFYLSLM